MRTEDLTLPALDGRPLAATIFTPEGPPRGSVVVLGALGVPRRYYRAFAGWLAERGVAALTFDYRGSGGSRSVPLRRDPATLLDWARLDASAAIDLATGRWGRTWAVGHSFGGQAIGLTPRALDLDGAAVIAAGSGDLSLYPPAARRGLHLRFRVALPLLSAALGYVPGRLGLGEDLPSGVVRQWAAWCLTPDYARGALGVAGTHHHRITAPMLFVDVSDDDYAPAGPSAALRGWYTRARATHRTVTPAGLGVAKIGHFGPFRAGLGEPIWAELLAAIAGEPARPDAHAAAP
jgi:predicted alpha/beta hydrolase